MKVSRKEREEREERAQLEAEWFYGDLRGSVDNASPEMREAAVAVEATLRSISTFHRGALSLWYTEKSWPEALREEFGPATSLVVRLACARTPSVGSTEVLEAAAAERLLAWIRGEGDDSALEDLDFRADKHFHLAIRALAKALPATPRVAEGPGSSVVLAGAAAESA
jgi:hypothetical protein